jgi:hypothetical protein
MPAWLFSFPGSLLIGAAAPMLLLIIFAALKKLIRGPGSRSASDWYQGIELCWAALSLSILDFYDTVKQLVDGGANAGELTAHITANTFYLIIALAVTIWVAILHQEYGNENFPNKRRQIWMLGIVANSVGAIITCAFVALVKGA